MNTKQLVLLMLLAILCGGLIGVASARELEVLTPNARITIADGEDVEIEPLPKDSPSMPRNWFDIFSRYRILGSQQPQLRVVPQSTSCERGSISSQTLTTTRSTSGRTYSHSSVTTTSCQ